MIVTLLYKKQIQIALAIWCMAGLASVLAMMIGAFASL